ncbi:nucleoside hydrolase [Microbacterium betulae]|uniref:Nucleoside hydrolase n=1 Tax=Microbacterium betulae TaxID=2981139 RepID=A0AA97I821_9MICO|nr:nucleoside hydrolase [Microbacterium sp. AB]WOF24227.1 nucleoside hydrolase [Microbacterium sp. AB]
MTTKIVLDVDTGIDDTLAILTACRAPEVELLACTTTWGNIDVSQAARNTAYVLDLAGRADVPVARGAEGPYLGGEVVDFATHVHGDDGQGGCADPRYVPALAPESAVELLLRLGREHAGELEIVAVGPLTNLAHALDADPGLPSRVRGVTIMGGTSFVPGNVTPAAEANIWHDPEAAQRVFEASWPVTMVGLDVTMRSRVTDDHRARLAAGGRASRYAADILDFYLGFYEGVTGERASANHDALALGVACGLVETLVAPVVGVEIDTTHGPDRGRTVADLRGMWRGWPAVEGARHRVVLEVRPGFEERMVDLIAGGPDQSSR